MTTQRVPLQVTVTGPAEDLDPDALAGLVRRFLRFEYPTPQYQVVVTHSRRRRQSDTEEDPFANEPGGLRTDDRPGSELGADIIGKRSGNQRWRLFQTYLKHDVAGLTDYDAGAAAGLLKSCYWKRCGELREKGLIETTGALRLTEGSDVAREVCIVSQAGWRWWRNHGQYRT